MNQNAGATKVLIRMLVPAVIIVIVAFQADPVIATGITIGIAVAFGLGGLLYWHKERQVRKMVAAVDEAQLDRFRG